MSEATRADLPPTTPSWLIGMIVALGYVVLLLTSDVDMPFRVIDPRMAPAAAAGGVLIYALVLWALHLRDPRVWRDRERFAADVRTWAEARHRPAPDAAEQERLRALAWHDGSIAIAQQAGAVAGAGAGATVSDHGWFLALIVFAATMVAVGLAIKAALMAPERSVLEPLLRPDA